MSRKSLQTPQNRRSVLGFGSARMKLQQKNVPEQKRLTFSALKPRSASVGGKRWSSQGTHAVKDTRPLSNRSYQKQMIEEILDFLNDSGYPHQISVKILSAPTAKEFLRVFEHLYSYINPNFKMDKRFEEEVPKILKSLCYPFTISKSAMFAIGSLHTWPTLLGALHWMVELIRVVNSVDVEEMIFPPSFAGEECDSQQEKIFAEYYSKTYQEFMLGADDFSEAREVLHSAILKQAGCTEEDHQALLQETEALEKELAMLEAEPDVLEEALKTKQILEEKIEQDVMAVNEMDQENVVLQEQYKQLQRQINQEQIDITQLGDSARQEEIKRKSAEVKVRLEHLNKEKERLEQQNDEREMRYSQLYDKFSAVVNEYNDIARELSLNPLINKYIGKNHIFIQFDHNQKDLTGFNENKQKLKQFLQQLGDKVADDVYRLESQKIKYMVELDKISEDYSEKTYEAEQLKSKLSLIDKELDSLIQLLDQKYQSSVQILRDQAGFLDDQRSQITKQLEEDINELKSNTIQFQQKSATYTKTENKLAASLMELCEKIQHAQGCLTNTMTSFNHALEDEIEQEKDLIKKLDVLKTD